MLDEQQGKYVQNIVFTIVTNVMRRKEQIEQINRVDEPKVGTEGR